MITRRNWQTACLALTLANSACLPMRTWDIPQVSGTIVHGSSPVANAKVTWLTLLPQEQSKTGEATTDSAGRFNIQAIGHRVWAPLGPIHAKSEWRLELREAQGPAQVLWHGGHYGPGPRSAPGLVVMECDLAQAEPCLLVDSDRPDVRGTSPRLPVR